MSYEYWAEGVGVWFHDNNSNPIKTRDTLKAYDPSLALLIAEIFGDGDWLYTPIQMRTHLPHLHGFNPQDAPRIEWPPGVVEAYEELRNPAIEERNEWVNLPPYDPSLIPSLNELRNGGGDDDSTVVWTDILVANTIDAEVLLYWVNPDGTETLEYRFPPNPWMIAQFGCRVGDLLLAKDSSGTPLAVFQAVEKVGRAFVGPSLNLITPGLSKNAGDNQSGVSGAVLPSPFVVEVRDENGSALEGISITFAVVAGDGTLSITHTTTDENGRAESSFILGSNLGTNTVSVSAAGIEQTVTFNAVAVAAVDIPDPNLRTAIENALGKGAGEPIIPAEMLALTHLEADNANISDLTGLEHATLLKSLELEGEPDAAGRWHNSNSVSDLSPLAGLTRLEVLELWGNSVSDISPLTGLTNLKNLGLVGNNISDISALVANTGLGTGDAVWLSGNPLNYQSFYTYIPALQSRGVDVQFDAGVTRPPDVNSDGRVDILDLVVIASKFGNQGQNLAADASGDGVIDVLDLMLVAGMFEGAAAAPSAQRQAPETLTAVEVQGWLTDARTLQVRDPIMKRGFAMLEQLLVFLTPRETELLSNYPNPFNPETWIPYRLAEDANVTLTIYDSSGQVIRTLDVGHRIASAYENRSKAIYWDGKNGLGEQVASGIYFYTLTAGDFSVTRRLVILK